MGSRNQDSFPEVSMVKRSRDEGCVCKVSEPKILAANEHLWDTMCSCFLRERHDYVVFFCSRDQIIFNFSKWLLTYKINIFAPYNFESLSQIKNVKKIFGKGL